MLSLILITNSTYENINSKTKLSREYYINILMRINNLIIINLSLFTK